MVLDEEALERMLARNNDSGEHVQAQLTDKTEEFEVYERPDEPEPVADAPVPSATEEFEEYPPAPTMEAPTQPVLEGLPPRPPLEPISPVNQAPSTEAAPQPVAPPAPQVLPTHAPEPEPVAAPTMTGGGTRIAIVHCRFNHEITERMAALAEEQARNAGAEVATVLVAGVYDAPLAAQNLLRRDDVDGVVVIGVVVSGDTDHDQVITHATATNLQRVALDTGKPVGLGVTGPGMSWAEAEARIGNAAHAVDAVLEQIALFN